MVPIYGISTFISLISLNTAFYVDTFRDIYEAFVIYAFFNLLLNKLGGERALIIMLHSRPPSENFFPGTLWSREIYVGDPYTFLFVKRGILQFIYVKPLLAIVTMVLKATGIYREGEISWSSSYLYITFIYNLSVCLSLWCLMVFFYATKKDLVGFRPLPKFLCVKAIIFFSFWQSVIIALLVSFGVIKDDGEHLSVAIQDFLVCIEMVPFAIAHSFAFSYEDYYDPNVHSARMPIFTAIKDSIGIKDVVMDTLDTFRGSKFNYKSFEPSEGVPHIGSSRTSRIMAGLRYSSSTSKKHWLEPAPTSKFLSTGRGINDEVVIEESEQLTFEDPDPRTDKVEALYVASRSMQFGDYNYPVIDFHVPLWRQQQQRYHKRRSGGSTSKSQLQKKGIVGYGGMGQTQQSSSSSGKNTNWLFGNSHHKYMPIEHREGCIDVIVEQGKGNYVVVLDSSASSSTSSSSEDDSTSFMKKPIPSASSSTTTTTTTTIPKQKQPNQRLISTYQPTLNTSQSTPPIIHSQKQLVPSTSTSSQQSKNYNNNNNNNKNNNKNNLPIPTTSYSSQSFSSKQSQNTTHSINNVPSTQQQQQQQQQHHHHFNTNSNQNSNNNNNNNNNNNAPSWTATNYDTTWQSFDQSSNIDYKPVEQEDDMFLTSNVWK
ncbi:unnamed protein product [Cunninghamella echinulata]